MRQFFIGPACSSERAGCQAPGSSCHTGINALNVSLCSGVGPVQYVRNELGQEETEVSTNALGSNPAITNQITSCSCLAFWSKSANIRIRKDSSRICTCSAENPALQCESFGRTAVRQRILLCTMCCQTPRLANAALLVPPEQSHRHRRQNPHPNGFRMGFGCGLVTLWMLTDGLLLFIQAHPTEFWMGYRWALDGLWMGVLR